MDRLFEWWDGVELWLVQLPFPLIVTLALGVLLPLFWWLSRLIDRVIDMIAAALSRGRDVDPPLRSAALTESEREGGR